MNCCRSLRIDAFDLCPACKQEAIIRRANLGEFMTIHGRSRRAPGRRIGSEMAPGPHKKRQKAPESATPKQHIQKSQVPDQRRFVSTRALFNAACASRSNYAEEARPTVRP
jgi:hypothetical protein